MYFIRFLWFSTTQRLNTNMFSSLLVQQTKYIFMIFVFYESFKKDDINHVMYNSGNHVIESNFIEENGALDVTL